MKKTEPRTTELYFIRHGEVENPMGVSYGRLPGFPLNARGVRQVEALTAGLNSDEIGVIFSSPQLRTTQTADIIARGQSKSGIRLSDLLDEANTPFDGLATSEMEARSWDNYTGNEPPYETPHDVLSRAQRFIQFALNHHRGQRIAAVTHGDIIAFILLWQHGAPITPENKQSLTRIGLPDNYPAHAATLKLTYDAVHFRLSAPACQYLR